MRLLPSRQLLRTIVVTAGLAALVLASVPAPAALDAQTLARPGWMGSGMATAAWWKQPVLYEIDVRGFASSKPDGGGDLKGVTQHLDYLQSLGVDAIVLDSLAPQAGAANATAAAQPQAAPLGQQIDPALGTFDDFDELSLEASRRNIRVLLSLSQPDLATARFWLNRGIAGIRLLPGAAPAGTQPASIADLRKLLTGFMGQRVVAADADQPGASDAELLLMPGVLLGAADSSSPDAARNAASLRAALEPVVHPPHGAPTGVAVLLSDTFGHPRSFDRFGDGVHNAEIAKLIATILLGTRTATLLDYGQEIGLSSPTGGAAPTMNWGKTPEVEDASPADAAKPKPMRKATPLPPDPHSVAGQDADPQSLLSFYHQLSELHRGNSAMRDGDVLLLDTGAASQDVLGWVRKPRAITPLTPAVYVLCNFSDKPVTLSLKAETARLHLRGSFLRTVLRSDTAIGSMDLDHMTLPPFEVYIGALRF